MAKKVESPHFKFKPPRCILYKAISETSNYIDCNYVRESQFSFNRMTKETDYCDCNFTKQTHFKFEYEAIREESNSSEFNFIKRAQCLNDSDSTSSYDCSESSDDEFINIANKSKANFNEALAKYTSELIQRNGKSLRSVLQYEITSSSSEELSEVDDDYTYELVRKQKEMNLLKSTTTLTFNFETDTKYESDDSESGEQTPTGDLSLTPKAVDRNSMNYLAMLYNDYTINNETLKDFRFNPDVAKQVRYKMKKNYDSFTDFEMVNAEYGQCQKNKYMCKYGEPKNIKQIYQRARDEAILSLGNLLFCPAKYRNYTEFIYPKTVKTRLYRMPIKSIFAKN